MPLLSARGLRFATAGLALGAAACARTPPVMPVSEPVAEAPSKRQLTPEPAWVYAQGAPLSSAAGLRAWLDGEALGQRVRLPVTLALSPLGVRGAQVGAPPDALDLPLDEGALGVSLADHARRHCGPAVGEAPVACTLWLEGEWGPPLLPQPGAPTHALRVYRVGEPVIGEVTHAGIAPRR